MKYVIINHINWADECDAYFFDILNEEDYKKYSFLQQTLDNLYGNYWFGANEGWEDDDFDYLQFKPKPITDEEIAVLEKFNVSGKSIIRQLAYTIESIFDYEGVFYPDDLWDIEYNEFCKIIDNNKELLQ